VNSYIWTWTNAWEGPLILLITYWSRH